MDDTLDDQKVIITIVQGPHGAQFDRARLHLLVGATTIWVNQTAVTQVILPDREGTRRVMSLAPAGQEGAVWMMQMRSSQHPSEGGGTFRWRLQSNGAARITIVTHTERVGPPDTPAIA